MTVLRLSEAREYSSAVSARASRVVGSGGLQYTPVDSSATVSRPHASSQSAIAFKSPVMAPNSRTGSSAARRGTATQWLDAPVSANCKLGLNPIAQVLSH